MLIIDIMDLSWTIVELFLFLLMVLIIDNIHSDMIVSLCQYS